jgi:hypothetical protein
LAERRPVQTLTITPIEVEIDNCVVTILEVARLPMTWTEAGYEYQASCQVRCGDVTSQVFTITYRDASELKSKLQVEVTKFRYMLFLYGARELRARGLAV